MGAMGLLFSLEQLLHPAVQISCSPPKHASLCNRGERRQGRADIWRSKRRGARWGQRNRGQWHVVKSTGTEELRTESVKRSSLLYHGRWGPPPAARRRKADFLRWLDGSFEGGGNSTSGRALGKRSRRGGAPGGAVGGVRGRGGDVLLENFDFFFPSKSESHGGCYSFYWCGWEALETTLPSLSSIVLVDLINHTYIFMINLSPFPTHIIYPPQQLSHHHIIIKNIKF
jgi:hypothetical protein